MRITVVGGGNIGTQFAVHCARKGHKVTMYTSNPGVFGRHLNIVDENGAVIYEGDITGATADSREAFEDAELILVTLPSNVMRDCAEKVFKYARPGVTIGVVPGNGGSECMFHECIERGDSFFLIERVPAIARLVEKGKTVRSVGYRSELHLSSLPAEKSDACCLLVSSIFDIPCVKIPGILNLTLTPSNPILHTARMASIFRDYHEGVVYERVPLFYEEWDDVSSRLLLACDDELQDICGALPELNLKFVKSLRLHYEAFTVSQMTAKISKIQAFKGIQTPAIAVDGGYIPDLHSRYFTADFGFGLSIIQQIGRFACVITPAIDETMVWYQRIALEHESFSYSDYGIKDRESLTSFYSV